jgi:hypothetical protein
MKHIPTFEEFLNESVKQVKYDPKPFDQVKPGDTAYVIGDSSAWEVIASGYGDEFDAKLKKYDVSGSVSDMQQNPPRYGMTKNEFKEIELIAIKNKYETAVYFYDDSGAWVNK